MKWRMSGSVSIGANAAGRPPVHFLVLAVSRRSPTQPIRVGSQQITSIPAKHRPPNYFATREIADKIGVTGVSASQQRIDHATSSIGNRPHDQFDLLM
jgi:hypothetical protein